MLAFTQSIFFHSFCVFKAKVSLFQAAFGCILFFYPVIPYLLTGEFMFKVIYLCLLTVG